MQVLFVLWVLSFIGILIWGNKSFQIKKINIELPSSFLELSSELREKSLDLSWKLGLSQVSSIPFRTIGYKLSSGIILFFCGLMSFINFVCLGASYNNPNPSDLQSISIWFIISAVISLLLLHSYYSKKKDIARSVEEERAKKQFNERLKYLGMQFVKSKYSAWIEEMDRITKPKAIIESQVKDVTSFTLFSTDYSLTPSGMPPKSLGVTYLFSNGFVSAVSGVIFDLMKTSYSFVNSNSPIYSYNLPNDWNTEEFHYSDVVEVTYKPIDASNSSIRDKNNDYPVEGYLTLSLVNSSKKEYPTTKNAVTNFISLARERVRNAKSSK